MGKGKKKKEVVTVSLGEFLEANGDGVVPIFKEIGEGEDRKLVNIAAAPAAPQSSFELHIRPNVLKEGPPYYLVAKNVPWDADEAAVREFFGGGDLVVELKYDPMGRALGVALVGLPTIELYKLALEKDGLKMGTRSIHLTQGKQIQELDNGQNRRGDKKKNYNNFQKQEFNDALTSDSNWRDRQSVTSVNPTQDADWRSNREPWVQPANDRQSTRRGENDRRSYRDQSGPIPTDSDWRSNKEPWVPPGLDRQSPRHGENDRRSYKDKSGPIPTDSNWRSNKEPWVPPNDRYGPKQGNSPGRGRYNKDDRGPRGRDGKNRSYNNNPADLDLSILRDKSKIPPAEAPKTFNRTLFVDPNLDLNVS